LTERDIYLEQVPDFAIPALPHQKELANLLESIESTEKQASSTSEIPQGDDVSKDDHGTKDKNASKEKGSSNVE
jgi:hypothetical protein